MSWLNLNSGNNNIHNDKPPLMSDGRNFSSWMSDEVVNDNIKKEAGITSNWDYRNYLQKNASSIMSYNSMKAIEGTGFTQTLQETTPNTPFLFTNTFDKNIPNVGYSNSDLKSQYLTSSQLNTRMVAPTISLSTIQ